MESIDEIVEKRSRIKRGWVSTVSRKQSLWRKFVRVFGKNLRVYFENSSLVGYRYLVEPHRSWLERTIWIVLHITTIFMLGLIVISAYSEYLDVPVVTVVASDNYPSNKLEFPGIAICNINRISRKAAIEFANEIVRSNVTNLEFAEIFYLLQQLGNLYDTDVEPDIAAEKSLHELLIKYYKGDYDVTGIMKTLSPSCSAELSSCFFQGERKYCSEIMNFRKTQDGYCCTFNYVRESDDISTDDEIKMFVPRQPHYINSLGISNGLSLVMEPFVEDYYYPILPIKGWKVTVFNTRDYPDNGSGSVAEALLSPATETFVELDATSFYSNDNIRGVSVDKRKCIFQDELPVLAAGYTYSDCLVDCRAAVIWDTCNCRPFFFPRRGNDQYNRKICNMADVGCLHENKGVYATVLSEKVKGVKEEENENGITGETARRCRDCCPACNDVRYYLRSSTTYLDGGPYHTGLLKNVRLKNQSIVHIYFTKHGSVRLRQEPSYYWYELLSNIGGICGVFIGFSLISVVEFLYFALRMIRELCRKTEQTVVRKSTNETTIGGTRSGAKWTKGRNARRFAGTLYWNEFLAHSDVPVRHGRLQRFRVQKY